MKFQLAILFVCLNTLSDTHAHIYIYVCVSLLYIYIHMHIYSVMSARSWYLCMIVFTYRNTHTYIYIHIYIYILYEVVEGDVAPYLFWMLVRLAVLQQLVQIATVSPLDEVLDHHNDRADSDVGIRALATHRIGSDRTG